MIKNMLFRRDVLLILILAIFLSLGSVCAIDTNSSDDTSSNLQQRENSQKFTDIQKMIFETSETTINLQSGVYVNDLATSKYNKDAIFITRTLTIAGSESGQTILDGGNLTSMFVIQADNVIIKNCKFINGNAENYLEKRGGSIFIIGNDAKIINCKFENNKAVSGGAVYTSYGGGANAGANLLIENCSFKNNWAYITAGAVGMFGNNSKVINCVFDSNRAYNDRYKGEMAYGGAIQMGMDGSFIRTDVINCTFKNNYAKSVFDEDDSHGGAGCVRDGSNYRDCIFINNSAKQGGALTLHASSEIINCQFYDNYAYNYGGAMSTGFASGQLGVNIKNCIFKNNEAPTGGAIQLKGKKLSVDNSTFKNNNATVNGGAIYIEADDTIILNSNFEENIANVNGGAIYIHGTTSNIKNNNFIKNQAIPDVKKLNDGLGGAIYINGVKSTIESNHFKYNTARNGSALYFDKNSQNSIVLNNEMFENQAWVYYLPIAIKNIYYTDDEDINVVIYGGNNIAKYNNLALSNGIYNAASASTITINGEHPVSGANTGKLYQDDREYNIAILLTVKYQDGSIVFNDTLYSNIYGGISKKLSNLKAGNYYVTATHFEDTYYKYIQNTTTFTVTPKLDASTVKESNETTFNYHDYVKWTITIANAGPSNATGVKVSDVLPNGLIYNFHKATKGTYDYKTGVWTVGNLNVGEKATLDIVSLINKTGKIVNSANISANEYDFNLANNFDKQEITVNSAADLAIVKTVNNTSPKYQELVTWTLKVVNNGPDAATGVKVSDLLPSGLVFVSSSSDSYNHNTGIWNIGNLAKGSSATLKIVTRVDKSSSITNEAIVSGNEYDYDLSNNKATSSIGVGNAADLAITKDVNSSNPNYHDNVKWVITVKNNGPNTATGVVVSDVVPKGLVVVSASGNFDKSSNSWKIDSIASGGIVTLNLITKIESTGKITNKVSVRGNEFDPDLSNNEASKDITVNPATDLAIEKTVDNTAPDFDEVVTWTLKVVNNGPDAATGVKVSDYLPSGLVFVSSSSESYNYNTGIWNIGNLAKGASATLKIVTKVSKTGLIMNIATVSGNEYDYDLSNNKANKSVQIKNSADLAILKNVDNSNPNYHDNVKWVITVKNNGPNTATGVVVSDVVPKGLVVVSASGNFDKSSNSWKIDSIASGGIVTLNLITKVESTGKITNKVSVRGNEFDPDLSNNEASKDITVKDATDLKVEKTVSNPNPNYGETITWTLKVVNNGPDSATGVKVSDLLPNGLVFISSSLDSYNPNTGIWNIGNLAKGASITLTIVTKITKTGFINNEAKVSGNEYDYDLSNNVVNKSVNVKKSADLAIEKSVNDTNPNYHDLVKWVITVKNNGPDTATGVLVKDLIPKGLIVIEASGNFDKSSNSWKINSITSGSSITLNLITLVNVTGKITNKVSVSGNEFDPDLSNNEALKDISVKPATDLVIYKSVNNSNPNYQDIITWTLKVVNNGPDSATGVKVSDLLPNGLVFISSSFDSYNPNTGIWNIGNLAKGASITLNIVTKVNKTGLIDNKANVSGNEYDWNLSNNKVNKTIDVVSAADLAIIKYANNLHPKYLTTVIWIVTVKNNGPDTAHNIIVKDLLPRNLIVIGDSEFNQTTNSWTIPSLASGESITLNLKTFINGTGLFDNVVVVSADEYDWDLSNNRANATITVDNSADLAIKKMVNDTNPKYGDIITWFIEVKNNGPNLATEVKVSDLLPEGMIFIKSSQESYNPKTGIWIIGNLEENESVVLNIVTKVNKTGDIMNIANVSSNEYDWDLSNNRANATIFVNASADLAIIKTVNNNTPNYHDVIRWKIVVINNGPDIATNVVVKDILPNGLIYRGSSSGYDLSTNAWYIDTIGIGETVELYLDSYVNITGKIINSANVSATEFDINPFNNHDEEEIDVAPAADVSVKKSVTKYEFNVGDEVEYTILLSNLGPNTARGIIVEEIFDEGLDIVSVTPSTGNYDLNSNKWYVDSLDDSKVETLVVKAIANRSGSLNNWVKVVSSTFDFNLANNVDSAVINVTAKKENKTNDTPTNNDIDSIKNDAVVYMEKTGIPFNIVAILVLLALLFVRNKPKK